jgi:hypothetical protein
MGLIAAKAPKFTPERHPWLNKKPEGLCRANRGEDEEIADVFIEARPKSRPEGSSVDDYVVEDHAQMLAFFKTQQEAIDWAKNNGHTPLVARIRHFNDRERPDHWRAA